MFFFCCCGCNVCKTNKATFDLHLQPYHVINWVLYPVYMISIVLNTKQSSIFEKNQKNRFKSNKSIKIK